MPSSRRLRSWPEGPTKGRPWRSSWKPGASPTNIRSAWGSPWPKTTWVRLWYRRQRVQPAASAATASSSVGTSAVPAGPAAAAGTGTRDGHGRAVAAPNRGGDQAQQPAGLRAAGRAVLVVGAAGRHQRLELVPAVRAAVLVERHASLLLLPRRPGCRRPVRRPEPRPGWRRRAPPRPRRLPGPSPPAPVGSP